MQDGRGRGLRVLLAIHHPLDPDMGAPGVTLALGNALASRGCAVDYFSYTEAFPGTTVHTAWHGVRFPWELARHLARVAGRYDVLDVTTGDCWPWARAGRPGALRDQVLVTRSHGLEHTYSERLRADSSKGLHHLSWKYPLYHGGFRLWEVRQSLLLSDHTVLLNTQDATYARERLGLPDARLSVIPHALPAVFHGLPPARPAPEGAPLRLAFVGSWLPAKGTAVLVAVAKALFTQGLPFTLTMLGTGVAEREVLESFPSTMRERLRVIPRYPNAELPRLLEGEEVLLFPSHSEGYGMALVEAMACGLVPVTTPVGVAQEVVLHEESGLRVPIGDVSAMVAAVNTLASDGGRRLALRRAAQNAVSGLFWPDIAERMIGLYKSLLNGRGTS
ncbi:glycosyltransferase family 1 protein [Corallococcus sp. H22C18031201]|nr:glycosyltransferase family 1 protein [Corallococcus sp. H22C18031201]